MYIKKFNEGKGPEVEDFLNDFRDFGFTCKVDATKIFIYTDVNAPQNLDHPIGPKKLVDSYKINLKLIIGEKVNKSEVMEMLDELDDRMLSFGFKCADKDIYINEFVKEVGMRSDGSDINITITYYRLSRQERKGNTHL